MNKEEIFFKLDNLELDRDKYIILSGASLVVQNIIKETGDIDLATDCEYYSSINWPEKIGAFGVNIKYKECFEIGNNLFEEAKSNYVVINDYKFLNIKGILEIKKKLNRVKDKDIIEYLENILSK